MSWDVGAWVVNTLRKLIENHGVQEFTSSGTFVVPDGVHKILVTACGGGQGGGAYVDNGNWEYSGKGGDGGECIIREAFSVTPREVLSIVVGSGGAKADSSRIGGNGGATKVGNLVTLRGGGTAHGLIGSGKGGESGGYYDSAEKYPPMDAEDGIRGKAGQTLGDNPTNTGAGGGGSYGNGGDGANGKTAATNPGYGGGGGGGGESSKTQTNGGKGIVIIEW